jgi:hypothetical protein
MGPCSFTDGDWDGFLVKRAALEITGGGMVYLWVVDLEA